MPRAMRVEYPGAIYHVMARGDRREDISESDLAARRRSDSDKLDPAQPRRFDGPPC